MINLPVSTVRMTFDDEFANFSSSPDGSSGTWMTRYPYDGEAARTLSGNDEAEYYSDSSVGENPFSDANGVLSINAQPAAAGSNPYNLPYDSGLITTDKSFSQMYGYFEATVKLPTGQGLWPAFWMLPASNIYTSELDIFEVVDNPSQVFSTTHGSTGGQWGSDSQAFNTANTSTGFHTYGVDWEPTTTTFYMDGVKLGSAPTPASMDTPMFMLLDLAVGGPGSWPGSPNAATQFPASMQIDSVRAYATANTTYVGGSAAIPATAAVVASPTVLGSGPDTLALQMAEDSWQGDAQFTVSVDGTQVGGVQTATASHSAGASQTFDVEGAFGTGKHTVSVNFLNDAWGGSASMDRNLYLDSASIDGNTIAGAGATLGVDGPASLTFGTAATPSTAGATSISGPKVIGVGPDVLALQMAEDAWGGDAQYTVSVDGAQIGGVQTATASHSAGSAQTLDVDGNFGAGQHTVSVDFLNDAWGGSASTDRNLFVDNGAINGQTISGADLTLGVDGAQSFTFQEPTAPPTGADTLDVGVSEDSWQGDAQYTISVDGTQIGGVRTATASHAAGATQDVSLTGNWGTGAHDIAISFINDAWGGSSNTDRNLYVDRVSYDGAAATPNTATLMRNGTSDFSVSAEGGTLTLLLAEDAYQGDAQYAVAVDGVQVGGVGTVTASKAAGASQAVNVSNLLSAGTHDIAVSFLNDAYGGSPTTDRNLYVKGVEVNGALAPGLTGTLGTNSTQHFTIVVPQT